MHSDKVAQISSTCQFTAGLRHCETTMVDDPLVVDHLARELCGEAALELAVKELRDLTAAQGRCSGVRLIDITIPYLHRLGQASQGSCADSHPGRFSAGGAQLSPSATGRGERGTGGQSWLRSRHTALEAGLSVRAQRALVSS